MSEEKRSAKLHKQIEIEDDEVGDCSERNTDVSAGIPTPTVQSASSSSGTSPDEAQPKVVCPPPITRKQTLIRGVALEGTSPPPESFFSQISANGAGLESRILSNGGAAGTSTDTNSSKGQSSHEAKEFLLASHKISNDSGHGTIDHNDGASDTSVLSRDSSLENASVKDVYKDSSGVNIPKFMKDTLQKSAKDRKTILLYEEQLLSFINNESAPSHKMGEMTSYDRMIVHRLAAFLGLEHNVDNSGKCVVLTRTENTRSVKLSEQFMDDDTDQEPKKKILLKKPASLDEKHSRGGKTPLASIKAKSLEERQQNYIEAKERIFGKNDENQPEGVPMAPHLLTAHYLPQIHHQRSLDSARCSSQLSTKWISTDSSGYGTDHLSPSGAKLRAGMTKTNSYGGSSAVPSASQLNLSMRRALSLSKAESLKDSPNTQYGSPPIHQQLCLSGTTPADLAHLSRSASEASSSSPLSQSIQCPQLAYLVSNDYNSIPVGSLIINPLTMQPHVNTDGSLYHFDPSFPPPFMLQQSQTQQAQPHFVYHQSDNVSELTSRLASASLSSLDQAGDSYQGQALPVMPAVIPHIQSIYSTAHPAHLAQGQYFTTAAATGQQPVRYITFPYHGQGQQMFQATPVEGQGQTTVPMPAIGIPAVPGAGSYQVLGSAYQQPLGGGSSPHCGDLSPAAAYHYGSMSETMLVGRAGGHNSASAVGTPHFILSYSQAQPSQPQQAFLSSRHQPQYSSAGSSLQGSFYAVPVSSPTPPLTLTQPPPASHHHPQQATVFYTNSIGNPLSYPVSPSNPVSSSTSTLKSMSTPFIQTQYRSSTPPQQQQPSHLHHPHHHQQPQHQQQPTVIASSNSGHHQAHLTLNYNQPVSFNSGLPASPAQGSQFVAALQPNQYHVRPVGTALIQLTGSPVMQSLPSGASSQLQSFQLLRPSAPISEVKILNPHSVRPRQSSIHLTSPSAQQTRPNQYRQNKRGGKKQASPREGDEFPVAQSESPSSRQQSGQHISIMSPPSYSLPAGQHVSIMSPQGYSLPGAVPQPHPLLQSPSAAAASSVLTHRQ